MRQAMFSKTLDNGQIECRLCPHYCQLKPGQTGLCHVRHNVAGQLLTSSYGHPVAMAVEPIEKKYLFHVYPGAQTLSLGTPGCNLRCQYCINWRVSQNGFDDGKSEVSPAEVIDNALAQHVDCIAFTYTEPAIFLEYALDIGRRARQAGLMVVAKSNGYMAPAVLECLARWLDAINIDLKGWHSKAYARIVGGTLEPVLESLKLARRLGLWLEVSTLIVPGFSDHSSDLENIAHFIATELGPDTPWHLLRFYPGYRLLDQPVTSQIQLQQASDIGQRAGLRYIYTRDLSEGRLLHTLCPKCGTVVIERQGYRLVSNNLRDGRCPTCDQPVAGIGLDGRWMPAPTPIELEVA